MQANSDDFNMMLPNSEINSTSSAASSNGGVSLSNIHHQYARGNSLELIDFVGNLEFFHFRN